MASKIVQIVEWQFKWAEDASYKFDQLDKTIQSHIKKKINKILDSKTNPVVFFSQLTGNLNHLYALRVGDYRLVCQIKDSELIILAVHVGHRRDVYNE